MTLNSLPAWNGLPLDHGHHMAWTSIGDAQAPPVLILHGGPGGRSRVASVNWFAGLGLRCIVFDQRGCGASTPAGETAHNHTAALVADIERLRTHLGLAGWAVAGGSWGALLAIAYAAQHPARVRGLFLRSAFLGTAQEVAWFFGPWAAWLGDEGASVLGVAGPHDERFAADPVALLNEAEARALSPAVAARIGEAWAAYEQAQAAPGGLAANASARWRPAPAPPAALAASLRVQWHYLRHGCFVTDAERMQWLRVLDAAAPRWPMALVHGQADAVCNIATSRALAARWAGTVLDEVPGAGHAMDHPALNAALTDAAARWAARWRG